MGKIFELYRKMAAGGGLFPDGPRTLLTVQGQTLSLKASGNGMLKLDAGDGSILTMRLPMTGSTGLTHEYASAQNWEVKQLGGSITALDWQDGDVISMNLNGNPLLKRLFCVKNSLTELDVSGCTELEHLQLQGCPLTVLNLTANAKLVNLTVSHSQLTQLDCSGNPLLQNLNCAGDVSSGQITALNVTACLGLETLLAQYNQLTTLDISNNPELVTLFVQYNQLTSLQIPENTKLTNVNLSQNSLDSTNIDHILLRLSQSGLENGEVLLNQTPAAPPGSQGEYAKQTLLQRGWTVQTD